MDPRLHILHKSEPEERYTLGVVYAPNEYDAHGDWADAGTIKRAAHDFLRRLQDRHSNEAIARRILNEVVDAADDGVTLRMDVDDIRPIAKGPGLNDMHVNRPGDESLGDVVESFIAPTDLTISGEAVKAGSWLLGVVWSPEAFDKIKRGERTGYSLEGLGLRTDEPLPAGRE